MAAIACPNCNGTEHMRRYTLYASERPAWYARLARLLGGHPALLVDTATGFAVECARCRTVFNISANGVWAAKETTAPHAPADSANSKPRLELDPADDHLMRTTRRPGLV